MRFFIECTLTCSTPFNTGIQRVVRNIVNASLAENPGGRVVIPVALDGAGFRTISGTLRFPEFRSAPGTRRERFLSSAGALARRVYNRGRHLLAGLLPWRPWVRFLLAPRGRQGLSRLLLAPCQLLARIRRPESAGTLLSPGEGDVLVLLDASWDLDIWRAVGAARQRGCRVVCVIYDLIPLSHPQFFEPHLVHAFREWLGRALLEVDDFLCISRTVAAQLGEAIPLLPHGRCRSFQIGHFWLGSELDGQHGRPLTARSAEVLEIVNSPIPLYLCVGTIEPRKNHAYALAAFDALWQAGENARLVMVGRIGWQCADILRQIRNHPRFGRSLFMLNAADDNTLAILYDRANGLICPSVAEGFGLPVVEALQRGLPVFASDIPVFREIGRQGVTFVDLDRPQSLQQALHSHIHSGAPRLPEPVSWMTWRESTRDFWEQVDKFLALQPERVAS